MRLLTGLILIVFASGCGVKKPVGASILAQAESTPDAVTGLTLPQGYSAEIVASGFYLPTHMVIGPDNMLYVTQLNGDENESKGQVVRISPNPAAKNAAPEVLLDGLLKPTGLTWADGALYIVSGNRVLVSKLNNGKLGAPEVVFKDIPFNGRSEGKIFTGPDGMLYFQSTGNEGHWRESGFIYTAKPGSSEFSVFARGLKNAYAMAWDRASGQMYTTEIGDGNVNNSVKPPEELNVVHRGGDYGWPQCYANQRENRTLGGNRNICADTDVPLALLPPDSTPTGLAMFDGKLIVALWNGNPPRLLSVDPASGVMSEYVSGLQQPIALLAPGGSDSGLLILDFEGGTLYRLRKSAS